MYKDKTNKNNKSGKITNLYLANKNTLKRSSTLMVLLEKDIKSTGVITNWSSLHSRALTLICLNVVYYSEKTNKIKIYTGEEFYKQGSFNRSILELGYLPTRAIIKSLDNLKLIKYMPGGHKILKHSSGEILHIPFGSRLIITNTFLELLEKHINISDIRLQPQAIIRLRQPKSPLNVNSISTNYYHYSSRKNNNVKNRLNPKLISQTRQHILYKFNELLSSTTIVISRYAGDRYAGDKQILVSDKDETVRPHDKQYNRTFHEHFKGEKFTNHGRYYAPLSNLKRSRRSAILFDGEIAGEVDIVSSHVLIAYALNGYDLTTMPPAYKLDGIEDNDYGIRAIGSKTIRKLFKQSMMMLFNTLGVDRATQALRNWIIDELDELNEYNSNPENQIKYEVPDYWAAVVYVSSKMEVMGYRRSFTKQTSKKWPKDATNQYNRLRLIVEAMKAKHAPLENWFNNPNANGRLVYLESEVITDVIEHFTAKGVPCLPVHDSVVVPESSMSDLKDIIIKSLVERTGIDFKNKTKLTEIE